MKILAVMCVLMTVAGLGCSSKHKMKDLDVAITEKGSVSSDEVLGLNDSGEAVIQKRKKAVDEVKGLVWYNNNLQFEQSSELASLRRCRVESADVRLGGSGDVVPLPEVDNMKPASKVKEEIGLVNEDILVVKEEYLLDRLEQEKKFSQILESNLELIKKNKVSCEDKLRSKRVQAGLPAERYQGVFKISSDGKLLGVTKPHEKNLDDAFSIKESEKVEVAPSEEAE